jgi:hypothetical protein
MKKVIVLFILATLLYAVPVAAQAAGPYLTTAPYNSTTETAPTHFYMIFNTAAEVNSVAVTGWGDATSANLFVMKHDLSTIPNGTNTVKARACVVVGGVIQDCSDYSAIWTFSKGLPTAPSILSVKEGTPPKYYLRSPIYAATVVGGPPTSFNVSLDGAAIVVIPAIINADGSTLFQYDITDIPTGTHTLNISASNVWGNSSTAAYTFQRYVVVIPKAYRILK